MPQPTCFLESSASRLIPTTHEVLEALIAMKTNDEGIARLGIRKLFERVKNAHPHWQLSISRLKSVRDSNDIATRDVHFRIVCVSDLALQSEEFNWHHEVPFKLCLPNPPKQMVDELVDALVKVHSQEVLKARHWKCAVCGEDAANLKTTPFLHLADSLPYILCLSTPFCMTNGACEIEVVQRLLKRMNAIERVYWIEKGTLAVMKGVAEELAMSLEPEASDALETDTTKELLHTIADAALEKYAPLSQSKCITEPAKTRAKHGSKRKKAPKPESTLSPITEPAELTAIRTTSDEAASVVSLLSCVSASQTSIVDTTLEAPAADVTIQTSVSASIDDHVAHTEAQPSVISLKEESGASTKGLLPNDDSLPSPPTPMEIAMMDPAADTLVQASVPNFQDSHAINTAVRPPVADSTESAVSCTASAEASTEAEQPLAVASASQLTLVAKLLESLVLVVAPTVESTAAQASIHDPTKDDRSVQSGVQLSGPCSVEPAVHRAALVEGPTDSLLLSSFDSSSPTSSEVEALADDITPRASVSARGDCQSVNSDVQPLLASLEQELTPAYTPISLANSYSLPDTPPTPVLAFDLVQIAREGTAVATQDTDDEDDDIVLYAPVAKGDDPKQCHAGHSVVRDGDCLTGCN